MLSLLYTVIVFALSAALVVFAYVDRIYRELGRMASGRVREHLDLFESEIEPRFRLARKDAAQSFSVLSQLLLIVVAVETARGIFVNVSGSAAYFAELMIYLGVELLLFTQFIPYLLLVRTTGRWLRPLVPALRISLTITWPFRALLGLATSLAHISDEEEIPSRADAQQEGIEALVEEAQEEGILDSSEAQLIEQVVEFSDKRILELMTPRPDIVAIPAAATIEDLRLLLVKTKVARVVVYQDTLDEVLGVAHGHDLLQFDQGDSKNRKVKEIVQPVLFVPETKLGSELLKEMQHSNQQMAIAVDEHGLVAGVVTIEDLVEEIVGEMSREHAGRIPDIIREPDGTVLLRGSVSLSRVQELFGIEFTSAASESATTLAGLLNSIAGHVPKAGESVDYDSLRFEVLEANQRKVLRLRVRPRVVAAPAADAAPH